MRVKLNKRWLIKVSRKVKMKEVRLRTKMIKFQEVDKRQDWVWSYITDHMSMILHRLHDYNITKTILDIYIC